MIDRVKTQGKLAALLLISLLFRNVAFAESPHEFDLQNLGYLPNNEASVAGVGFGDDGTLRVRVIGSATTTLKIDPKTWRITTLPSAEMKPTYTPAGNHPLNGSVAKSLLANAKTEEDAISHPLKFGTSALTVDEAGGVYLTIDGKARSRLYSRKQNCDANQQVNTAPASMYAFLLDEMHICVFDCGTYQVVGTRGEHLYTIPSLYPTASIARSSSTFVTLDPEWTFVGRATLSPEDSSELRVFCLANGKVLLKASWPKASFLATSGDGGLVAIAGNASIRVYRVGKQGCPN
jgi:hypothetical protein